MISLSQETEALAQRLAVVQRISVEDAITQAIEERARVAGISLEPRRPRKRLNVGEMLAVGAEIAALPLLDPRSAYEIMDDLNAS